jgi:hypothetical protein
MSSVNTCIEHLNNYIHDLETAAATDREELLEANRIIEVRDNNLNNIAESLGAGGVDFIQEEINIMKERVAWIGEYKEKFNQLGNLLELKEHVDDGNTHYRPDDIIYAVAKLVRLVEANASQPSSSKMSSEMFKL